MSAAPGGPASEPGRAAEPTVGPFGPVGPFGLFVTAASPMFLVAAIVWPEAAEMLLRILLATVAAVYTLARAWEAGLPEETTQDSYSPFRSQRAGREADGVPRVVWAVAREIGAADDPRRARRTDIPWAVGHAVAAEASRRLADRHGLHLDDDAHHGAIRSLVSEPTWLLIASSAEAPAGTAPNGIGQVPLSRLERILDDLENL